MRIHGRVGVHRSWTRALPPTYISSHDCRLGSHAQHHKQQNRNSAKQKHGLTFLTFGLIGNMDMLGMAVQPTDNNMQNELISNLTSGLLQIVIALFFAAIMSMLIGYRVVAKRLKNNGMKKGDALATGQTIAGLLFVTPGYLYLKFFVLA